MGREEKVGTDAKEYKEVIRRNDKSRAVNEQEHMKSKADKQNIVLSKAIETNVETSATEARRDSVPKAKHSTAEGVVIKAVERHRK